MDIIITIPKTDSWQNWLKECQEVASNLDRELRFYLGKRGLPKKTNPGDKCFVVFDGYIRGYHIISQLAWRDTFVCLITGRVWKEGNYIIRRGKFYPIEPIKMKGFQGFRYAREINYKEV